MKIKGNQCKSKINKILFENGHCCLKCLKNKCSEFFSFATFSNTDLPIINSAKIVSATMDINTFAIYVIINAGVDKTTLLKTFDLVSNLKGIINIASNTIHAIFAACLYITSKFINDINYNGKYWIKVLGIPPSILRRVEFDVLSIIDYKLLLL